MTPTDLPTTQATRRRLLKQLGAAALSPAALPLAGSLLAMRDAAAETATDYKALVCVFLLGGNDTFNTVLATDATSWTNYMGVRASSLALKAVGTVASSTASVGSPDWLGGVLPLSPLTTVSGRSFALHPRLSKLQTLFNTDRRLAIVANVGPLVQPLTRDQWKAAVPSQIPRKLFSHNDQQNTWQALAPEGASVGWGGRFVDAFVPANAAPNAYSAMSPAGNSVWLSGKTVRQYQLTNDGVVLLDALKKDGNTLFGSADVSRALKRIVSGSSSHLMTADLGSIGERSISAAGTLSTALDTVKATDTRVAIPTYTHINGSTPNNPLAQQLQIVARSIAVQSTLGAQRQVFFVTLNGFDTHDNQSFNHAELMSKLNHALAYFDTALTALGVSKNVTTFTASDFGRSFTSNGDGTDHGWGAHHFVMGGAVSGGKVYGTFPKLGAKNEKNNNFDGPAGSTDQLFNGVLLPTTSVDQYGATLGKWFGLTDTTLMSIFPNLGNFKSTTLGTNLGFMSA